MSEPKYISYAGAGISTERLEEARTCVHSASVDNDVTALPGRCRESRQLPLGASHQLRILHTRSIPFLSTHRLIFIIHIRVLHLQRKMHKTELKTRRVSPHRLAVFADESPSAIRKNLPPGNRRGQNSAMTLSLQGALASYLERLRRCLSGVSKWCRPDPMHLPH